jgi:type I restriction enzyme S subunit
VTEWREVALGDVIELKRGYDLPTAKRREGSVPIVSSSGPTGVHDEAKVQGPGVVTGRYGTLGEVFYVEEDFWPLNTALYVRDFKGNHPRFVAALLSSLDLGRRGGAAAVPGVNRNHLHVLPVTIPEPETQMRIAAVLETFDVLIENSRRRIAMLEQMAQAIYREWFVHFRYPGHEDDELGDSPLGPIPADWEVIPVSSAIEINPSVRGSKGSEVPFVAMGDLTPGLMIVGPGSSRRFGTGGSRFTRHDTLFARITPSVEHGKTGFVQFLNDGDVGMGSTEFLVFRGRRLSPYSTYLLARRDDLRQHAIGSMFGASGRQRVNNACFDTFAVAVPPVTLERRFASYVAPAFASVEVLSQVQRGLERLRDLLLPKLVSGAIDVSGLYFDALVDESAA